MPLSRPQDQLLVSENWNTCEQDERINFSLRMVHMIPILVSKIKDFHDRSKEAPLKYEFI
jgi:hypothetical protein